MDAALRKHCQTRKGMMLELRQPFEADWRQVAEYVDPWAGKFLMKQDKGRLPSRAKVINNKATNSLKTMNAGFMGGHTSKTRPWFKNAVANAAMLELPEVRAWLDDVAQRIRDVLATSNFYTELPRFYNQRHLFGVGSIACDEDKLTTVRFYTRMIGTYAIAVDHRGRVDSFWYCYDSTASQLKAKHGEQGLPQKVLSALAGGKGDQIFQVESLIEPNPDAKPGMQPVMHRPFRQVYWIDGGDSTNDRHGCLDIGGHYDFPIPVSRWDADSDSVYSSSPALDSLGDIKQLQYLESEKLRIIDQMSKPTLALPSYLRGQGVGLNAGERIYITPSQTQQEVKPVYTPDARGLMAIQEEIRQVEGRVERAFFADLFRMLDFLDDKQRTAYEISERKEEKVAMLGPALESLTDEVLDPVIIRVYGIMERNGMIPPPPEVMRDSPVSIEYTSILAQAQKAAGLGTIERTVQFIGALLAMNPQDPSPLDKLDIDQTIDEFHDRNGGPARMVRGDEQVQEIRDGRQKQQQMAQMAQMAKPLADGAQALKTLKEAMPEGQTLADGMGM
jgi:hypothetical protein